MQLWQAALDEKYRSMAPESLGKAIDARRGELGRDLVILGHHYQSDEVLRHADYRGDSLKLSQLAAERVREAGAKFVVFCGVHFMAESADLLAPAGTAVILPDLSAGCSMADMAAYEDAIEAWEEMRESLAGRGWKGRIVPVTYVNSSAAIKAFVGANGGACCTSSNAKRVFEWAMRGGATPAKRGEKIKVLFLPDQHLGRNTAAAMGVGVAKEACLYDPKAARRGEALGGIEAEALEGAKVILWAGHCSVHKLFRPEHCVEVRERKDGTRILVHPECCKEVVDKSDLWGSTEFIIRTIEAAAAGSRWAVGTEIHLVNRLAREASGRGVEVRILSDCQCLCTTMFRIDERRLLWALDNLAAGRVVNQVKVHADARAAAVVALERMLSISAEAEGAEVTTGAGGGRGKPKKRSAEAALVD